MYNNVQQQMDELDDLSLFPKATMMRVNKEGQVHDSALSIISKSVLWKEQHMPRLTKGLEK